MASKAFLMFLALWLSFSVCLAEEPTFPYPTKEDHSFDNQYIVQFERNSAGNKMKQVIMVAPDNEEKPRIMRKIKSRNIFVIKFPSARAAARWNKKLKGIKFFDKGKDNQCSALSRGWCNTLKHFYF